MALIQINEKNKNQYGGKCVVLQSHIHEGKEVKPGAVVTKVGMEYFEAIKCKMVRPYDPALDEKPVEMLNAECSIVNETPGQNVIPSEVEGENKEIEPKKIGPKKRRTKKEKTQGA